METKKKIFIFLVPVFLGLFFCAEKSEAAFDERTETFVSGATLSSPYQVSAAVPAGTANGDLMFAYVTGYGQSVTANAAWTLIASYTARADRYWLYARVASSEPASYTWTFSTTNRYAVVTTTYIASTDFAVSNVATDITVSNSPYVTSDAINRAASFSVPNANSIILFFGGVYSSSSKTQTPPTNPGTFTEDYDAGDTNPDFWQEIAYYKWSGSGVTGNIDSTISLTSTTKHAFAIALKPPNSPPTLSISQPPGPAGGYTQIAEGSTYNVTYTLSDSDNVVTAAFYYETDGNGTGGTAITGTCATAAEGTNATCAFDTSVLPVGTGYYIYGVTSDGVNPSVTAVSLGLIIVNDLAALSISQPTSGNTAIAEGSSYNITYTLTDPDSVATVTFYYETDGNGSGGTAVTGCGSKPEGTNATCSFNTSVLSTGTAYYIYGVTSGEAVNPSVTVVSSGTITPNDAPTLSISQPDGVSDSINIGAAYNITYSLTDADNVVAVAFYYDTNNSGLDGNAISGACATAAEGTNVTCAWDTTGMAAGSYYIYGKTSGDSVNPQASAYSSGTITLSSGSLSVDIVDSGGTTVGSPSVSFSSKNFSWSTQQSTGTLGISSQKIRLTNTTATPNWTLAIAATSGPTTLWSSGGSTYDFNGSSSAGRLRVDASGSTITAQGGCSTTGLSKGSATYFAQGSQDSVTLMSASVSAQTSCYWDLTGVSMTQDIPASQSTGSYSIGMTLTAT